MPRHHPRRGEGRRRRQLHLRLTERGFKGSYGSVYEFVTKRLGAAGKRRERSTPPSRRSRHRRQRDRSPSSGPAARRNGSLPIRRGSKLSAPGATSWPRHRPGGRVRPQDGADGSIAPQQTRRISLTAPSAR